MPPRHAAIAAVSLFGVLALAKGLVLAGRDLPLPVWAPLVYLWQDALVVLVFGGMALLVRRPRLVWGAYGCVAAYTAANASVAGVLSTPLTWPMLRATDAALTDSIAHHLTWKALAPSLVVAGAAVVLPGVLRRVGRRTAAVCGVLGLLLVATGALTAGQLTTLGLHRNAVVALLTSAFPRVAAADAAPPRRWRQPVPGAASEALQGVAGAATGRNVVMVVLESAAAAALAPYGAPDDPMPNLTRLAGAGLLFEAAYAVYPESIKGMVALQHAVHPALDTEPESYAHVPAPSLARVLGDAGYRTALFHSGRFEYLGMQSVVDAGGYQTAVDAGDLSGQHDSSFGVDEPTTVARLLAWIDETDGARPFFASYLPIAGHHPYDTPEPGPFPSTTKAGAYRNALHYADRALGQLVRGLQERDLWRDTVLVVVGDHGQAFGEHEGNFGHTFFLYEENVHVPLLVAAPGLLDHAGRSARVASHVDVAPSILDLLGLPIPQHYEGRSLFDATDCMALMFTDYSLAMLALRDGPWKLIHEVESGRSLLFDLRRDPAERCDLTRAEPDRVARYRAHLLAWCAAQRAAVQRWR